MSDLLKQKVNSILNSPASRGQQVDELLDLYLAESADDRFEIFGAVVAALSVSNGLIDAIRRKAEKGRAA